MVHYDPTRTDAALDELAAQFCAPGRHGPLKVLFAREGQEIEL
jgi:hypothetical protein